MAENEEEVQQPEKPVKKKKSSGGGLSLPVMIAIGVGTLVIIVVVILFAISYMVNNIMDQRIGELATDSSGVTQHADKPKEKGNDAREEIEKTWQELEEEEYFGDQKGVKYMETGRIITNPKLSEKFAVINLGLSYREKVGEEESSEESADAPDAKALKMEAQIKSILNNMIGSMTEEEIQHQRQNLSTIVKEKLTPLFKKNKMFLREVLIVEFIIQS